MPKHWTAFKSVQGVGRRDERIKALYLDKNRAVFHKIDVVEADVITPDGHMIAVHIRNKVDLCNPDNDIAALVGKVELLRKSGVLDPQSPEIWYWNDKFWVKAVDAGGTDYYHKSKAYLFYEITVEDRDEFLAGLVHAWNREAE